MEKGVIMKKIRFTLLVLFIALFVFPLAAFSAPEE